MWSKDGGLFPSERAILQGRLARLEGMKLSDCPCADSPVEKYWIKGWDIQDAEINKSDFSVIEEID
jgi:ribosome modulation factor